jgi:selenocysteine lyase/cysteine desulfurase
MSQTFPDARGYLDTGTLGLPPAAAADELERAVDAYRHGRADARAYDAWVERARDAFARLAGVPAAHVAISSQASLSAGLVAASLPAGAQVVCAANDFTSVLFPFLVQRERGVAVHVVELDDLADAVTDATTLVAVSAVQSADGRVADLDGLEQAAAHGALTFVDATQALGWLPFDAGRFDFVACAAYKWLLCPRGVAFLVVRPERLDGIVPHAAGWYAGEDRWDSIYGEPLRLAGDARRLDVSPAWLSWVGAAPALEHLAGLTPDERAHGVRLASAARAGLGLPPSESAIVMATATGAKERLERAGVKAAVRDGAVRLCFHVYNDEHDVDTVVSALS